MSNISTPINRRAAVITSAVAALSALTLPRTLLADSSPDNAAPAGFPVEYYYRVRWGFFDEFMALYVKNHYPILRRYKQLGRILSMSAAYPVNHASESARWDLRFTIVWKDAATAHEDFAGMTALMQELYPDQALFKREEQRRFELLLEHTDIPIVVDDLTSW